MKPEVQLSSSTLTFTVRDAPAMKWDYRYWQPILIRFDYGRDTITSITVTGVEQDSDTFNVEEIPLRMEYYNEFPQWIQELERKHQPSI
ncbi:hypothetical protein ADL35_48945 [Streptomyces sp. NRRL WC-3753]|nr:hypothetical protein ADL35_48945 [Streptomyces sp. NRRL WC-3753]